MYYKIILNQLIALTKEIKLTQPANYRSFESFIAGPKVPFFRGGIGINWWFTDKGTKLCDDIASMSIEKYSQLREGDKDKLSKLIREAFQIICIDSAFFNTDAVFLRRKENLFEARAINDVDAFSKQLWDFILSNMENNIGHWCVIHPLPRLHAETEKFSNTNIYLLSKTDLKSWKELESEYPDMKYWSPATGLFTDNKPTIFRN